MNNESEYFIIGAIVRSEYSNIWYLLLTIGNAQKFVLGDKNGFEGRNYVSTAATNLLYFTLIKTNNQISKIIIV